MNMTTIRTIATRMSVVALCSAALCSTPMLAQGRGMMAPEQRVEAIDKAVTLTPDQKTKILALYTEDQKKMQALRDAQDPDMRTKMMDMRKDENSKIKDMLNDDQKSKFDDYVASMPMGRPAGPPPQN
jgi:Spy/CpxP family protein refolding chaperone